MLTPTAGDVLLDGLPAREWVRTRGPVGYVGANNFLILGSLRENLRYGLQRPATDDELWSALAQVGLDGWVRSLPGGWNYQIGENEEGLSSGQQQRLALARAFLRRPSLLILDEASANLDAGAESELAQTLGTLDGRCTMIIVSHKPGILAGVDDVLRLGEEPHG